MLQAPTDTSSGVELLVVGVSLTAPPPPSAPR